MLHETTQRRVCRFAFLAVCVLPTLLVLAFVAQVWLPTYARRWETPLGRTLDCRATITQLRQPRPGVTQCGEVVLSDPETDTIWAVLQNVSCTNHQGKVRVSVALADVSVNALSEFSSRMERLLRCDTQGDVMIDVGQLRMSDAAELRSANRVSSANVHVQLTESDTGCRMQLWSGDSSTGLRLLVQRNRQLDPPATLVTLQTGNEPIACTLLARFCDGLSSFDPQAEFCGNIEWYLTRDTARGRLAGDFTNVNLSTYGAAEFGASCEIEVEDLSWNDGRIESLAATLHAGPGQIGREFVRMLVERLQFRVGPQLTEDWSNPPVTSRQPDSANPPLSFDALQVRVQLDAGGAIIRGFDNEEVVLVRIDRPLLLTPPTEKLPLSTIVGALSPSASNAWELARLLPPPYTPQTASHEQTLVK